MRSNYSWLIEIIKSPYNKMGFSIINKWSIIIFKLISVLLTRINTMAIQKLVLFQNSPNQSKNLYWFLLFRLAFQKNKNTIKRFKSLEIMNPLTHIQQVLKYFCINSNLLNRRDRIIQKMLFFSIAITFVCFFASVAYFVKYVSIDFEASLYAAFEVSAAFFWAESVIANIFSYQKLTEIFNGLKNIYETSENTSLKFKTFPSNFKYKNDVFSRGKRTISIFIAHKWSLRMDIKDVLEIRIGWISNFHVNRVCDFYFDLLVDEGDLWYEFHF